MKKFILMLFMISVGAYAQDEKKEFTIDEGTIIKLSIDNDVNGKDLKAGDVLNFTTTEDLVQGNYIVLHKGLKAIGTVTEAAKSKALGKKGKLSFTIDYLYLPDNKILKLKNEVTKNNNGSGGVVAATSVVLTPLALFIKGKNAKYKKGDLFQAFVAEKTLIN